MIEIRPAAPADLDAVTALFLRCWQESYAGVLPDRVISVFDDTRARELWRRAIQTPGVGTQGFVAVADGRVVGITRLGPDPDDPVAGHVFSLYVDPSMQGQGIGGQLLEAADAWFRARGWDRATLWVFAANDAALRFYGRHGWQPDGGQRSQDAFGEPEIRLRRDPGGPVAESAADRG